MKRVEIGFGLKELANVLRRSGVLHNPEDYIESVSVSEGYVTPSGKGMNQFISINLMEKEKSDDRTNQR